MTGTAIPGPLVAQPPGLAAAVARVRQIEALLAQAGGGASGTPAGGGFAATLAAAEAQGPSPAATGAAQTGLPATAAPVQASAVPAPAVGLDSAQTLAEAGIPTGGAVGTPGAGASASAAHAYDALIEQAAARNGIAPAILHGLIEQESGFNPSARSSAGALGLTQLMPSTATAMGVTEPLNPVQSIEGGARYLGTLMREFGGNLTDALAAYNAGPGAVRTYGGVPPYAETEAYVAKVLANAQAYSAIH